jgi:hypothetical protein
MTISFPGDLPSPLKPGEVTSKIGSNLMIKK